jgi:hypothetical protein
MVLRTYGRGRPLGLRPYRPNKKGGPCGALSKVEDSHSRRLSPKGGKTAAAHVSTQPIPRRYHK